MGWLAAAPFSISRRPCANSKPPALLTHTRSQSQADRFVAVRVYLCWTTARGRRCKLCKEEVVMPETKRMAEEANRMGEEVRDRAQRVGHEFQKAAEGGFEAASRSLSEVNRGFQAMAAEMTDF